MAMIRGERDLDAGAVTDHGGSLDRMRALFPGAAEPWVDLSTGISPHSYPHSPIPATAFSRLPEAGEELALRQAAARAYGVPSCGCVAAAPGTQALLPMVTALVPPGRAAVLAPTYAEHARAARLSGHAVTETADPAALAGADIAIVVNPNNPDGRVMRREELLRLAGAMDRRGGLLVVDEAFMDVGPREESLCGDVADLPVVVLRSFGKFYGLAGLRLGFAVAREPVAARLRALLGPWAVSGPALAVGREALADAAWAGAMRDRLGSESRRLDGLIRDAGLTVRGGTALYRFVRDPRAAALHRALGRAGVAVRAFDAMPDALRFGLPGDETGWRRLAEALSGWTAARLW